MQKCELCRAPLWPGEVDVCGPCETDDIEFYEDDEDGDDYDTYSDDYWTKRVTHVV